MKSSSLSDFSFELSEKELEEIKREYNREQAQEKAGEEAMFR